MRFLNVGGGSKRIAVPAHFAEYEHVLLDIDPSSEADIICDALEIKDRIAQDGYDAVYCSHNLEHYHRHHTAKILDSFKYILAGDGFVEIHVPNMQDVVDAIAAGADIEDVAYISKAGPIKYMDMIYGLSAQIESSGNDFMCHKNGFTPKSLGNALFSAGFTNVFIGANKSAMEIVAFAFKRKPSDRQMEELKLKDAK